MFTVEYRDRVRDYILEMARSDPRIVAGALVGGSSSGGDRWSDLDLTFGIDENASIAEVLSDWTAQLERQFQAVMLFDLPYQSSVYRVHLCPGNLQVDISLTPKADFGARGPWFKLLWGKSVELKQTPALTAEYMFGHAAHLLLRARIFIERGRLWQAEYLISEARDYVLAMACLARGLETRYGRGFDKLPLNFLESFREALIGSIEKTPLLKALSATLDLLLANSKEVSIAARIGPGLRELEASELT